MKVPRHWLAPGAVVVFLAAPASGLLAQEQKIECNTLPAPVRASFEKTFAKATIDTCAKDVEKGKATYEIVSAEGEIRRHVRFHPDGKIFEIEEPIAMDSVPEPVKLAMKKKHPNVEITLAEKVTRGTQVLYEFSFNRGTKVIEVLFDANGKEMKKQD